MEMEENPELEEGEALDGGYNNNMDPDIALSYIDEKIQHVLGHFQKDFEGGVSAENLGAKFGGYGSFLPTYERSPQRSSQPKTPQRNCSTQKSPNNLPVEGVSQSVKVPLNDAASVKLGISSGSSNALRKSGLPSNNVPVKKESSLFKKPHKSGRFSDQRSLKVRIKVGPDSMARKNAAIYSGLGLENSPSSSLGYSPEVSGGIPSQQTADESPTSILQVMTSFPVPGGAIVSPLHDDLLCLMKRERFSRDVKPLPIKGGQANSGVLVKESVSLVSDEKPSRKKGMKFPKKSETKLALKHESDTIFGNGTTFPTKMKLENENPESKNVITNNFKSMPLPGTEHGDGTLKVTSRPTEVPWEADEDGVGGRIFSPDLMKEDSLESRSGQDSGKSEKRSARTRSGSVDKVPEFRELPSSNDVHLKGNKKSKKSKARALSRACSDASGNKEELPRGSLAPSKRMAVQQASFCLQDESLMASAKEKPLSEAKKLPVSKNSKQGVAHGSVEIGVNRESKEATHGVSKSKDQMPKLRFPDSSKFRDNLNDHTKSEKKNSQMRLLERSSGNKRKDSTIDGFGMVQNASFDNLEQGFNGKQVDKQPIHSSVRDVANVGISPAENALAFEVLPPAPAPNPVIIEEHWVCCDSCQKWRLLPQGTLPEHLPEKWLCRMLNWLPGMNRCDISEEETTKALNALYHVPLAAGQNNLQNDTSRTASAVQVQHVDHSLQGINSLAVPMQAKKKQGLKEIAKAGVSSVMMRSSNSPNNHLQESVKSRSVNNMNQPPAEANLANKSNFYALSKSQNLVAEVKRSPLGGGITKQVKMKNKREADHYGYGNPKKTKTDLFDSDKHCSLDTGLGRMGLNSESGFSIKVRGKDVLKSNECSFSGDVKCDSKERLLVSMKKLCDPPQVSSDGGSLNVGTSDKRSISIKKRKLKEWQDDQNGLQSTGNDEDIRGSGLKKVKKLKVSKSGACIMNNTRREKLDKTEVVAHILSSGSQDHAVDGVSAERRIRKDQRLRKHRGNFTQQHLDATDSSRKDLGLGQLSTTATSSSSKVSGSLKTRTTLEDAKGSPVESVSSSPMRISFSEKLGSTGGGILGKDDAMNGDLPVVDGLRTRWDQKGDDQIHQSGTGKKEKLSGGPHPKSFKILPLDYQDGNPKLKVHQSKRSSQLLNSGGEIVKQHKSPVDLFAMKNCHDEVRTQKNRSENMPPLLKSGKGSSLQLKENDRSSISDIDRDQKLSEPGNAQVDVLYKRTRKEAEVDLRSHTPLRKRTNNVKHTIPDKPSNKFSKDEKVHVSRSNSASQFSTDGRTEIPLKCDADDPNNKLVSLDRRKRDTGPRGNLVPGFDNEIKPDSVQKELRPETSSLVPNAGLEAKHESHDHQSERGAKQERTSDGHFPNAPENDLVLKASIRPGSCGKMNGVQLALDAKSVKDITAPVPASSQTATDVLEEAKTLRDYSDRLKISGFSMESNEINFQAARKFLHGAFLLETCNEVGRQGEMTHIQAYSLTAKLCECSAVEYEGRREMAAAALAYKCLEVAHWRIVYCKSSGVSRDRNELQACLQTFSQGESPSSSASDIDNLNNQAIVDKASVPKSTISHVAGHPVIAARNTSSLFRVLDYTQDVANAWEASRKSQNAHSAADLASKVAQNKDCLVSVKKAIDFGFQDVVEFLHLVQQATEAITRAGPVNARE